MEILSVLLVIMAPVPKDFQKVQDPLLGKWKPIFAVEYGRPLIGIAPAVWEVTNDCVVMSIGDPLKPYSARVRRKDDGFNKLCEFNAKVGDDWLLLSHGEKEKTVIYAFQRVYSVNDR